MEGAPRPKAGVQVERVFGDFRARRSALVKALTDDADVFYEQCDPDAEEALCLFGDNEEQWRVDPPAEIVPTNLPEPALGINWVRDTMPKTKWLYVVAKHGDAWLHAVASVEGSRLGFRQVHREQLFDMIKELPTLYEAVHDYYYFQSLMPVPLLSPPKRYVV
ncbi:hypothetical protein K1719_010397 [Acacia pycnantha]|nr:hypothetical protein K1719_010397 [Acacia pycnantha]